MNMVAEREDGGVRPGARHLMKIWQKINEAQVIVKGRTK